MNFLHMKYAVEIAETNSINKAAEKLFVGQSNLSRAIKELETSLGVILFERSAKGMTLTPDGEIFVRYAKTLLKQVDVIEDLFSNGTLTKKRFSISVPRASYISAAFSKFTKLLDKNTEVELFYRETNNMRAIKNILHEDYKLGMIRYAQTYDRYYKEMMEEKGLESELITEVKFLLVMNEKSPLASVKNITYNHLKDYIEIAHADPYVPSLPFAGVMKEELPANTKARIFVFERASQFELLSENPDTFMWMSPMSDNLLKRYGLVKRYCEENKRIYKDLLIYSKNYKLTDLDKLFIEQLIESKNQTIG